jgi:Zn-finger nucleic acid-binding protein
MNCPFCPETNLVMSERQGIEIDYCPKCRGIWLDRGELDKIIEKSQSQEPDQLRRAEVKDSYYSKDGHHRPYKRKKSFLEEIFD